MSLTGHQSGNVAYRRCGERPGLQTELIGGG